MKLKLLAGLVAAAASLMAGQAHAGAVAIANMNITALGFAAANPPAITITNELRTGTAAASYNGVDAVGVGDSSITEAGATTVDVKNRCAGACGSIPGGTYNGSGAGGLENATNHIGVPGSANYALGDMLISGQALGASISGLTRADAVATGPNNLGGANATILNSGVISGTFTTATTFKSAILLQVDAFIQAWIDPATLPTSNALASAGYGWNMTIDGSDGLHLEFKPSDLNKTLSSSSAANNGTRFFSTGGPAIYLSDEATFSQGVTYEFTINQSSNATARDRSRIPEPASLALLGIAVAGAGFASRRRKAA